MPMQQKLVQGSDSRTGSTEHGRVWCVELQTAKFPQVPSQMKSLSHQMEYLALRIDNQCSCCKSWFKAWIACQGPPDMAHVWCPKLQTAKFPPTWATKAHAAKVDSRFVKPARAQQTWRVCGGKTSKQPTSLWCHPKSNPWDKIPPHGIVSPWYGQPMPMQQKLAQVSDSRPGSPEHGPCVVPRTPNS